MGITLLHRIVFSFARLIGIWFITDDMPPYQVAEEAKKKWGSPSAALTQLLQTKTPSANVLYASCLLWNSIAPNDTLSDPQTLQTILRRLPSPMQADAFALATNGDTDRAAYLLIKFLPPVLPGLTQIAREIAERWSASARSDDLSLGFYQSLSRYGFSQEQTQWVIARTLVARAQYAEAEPLLLALAQIHPSLEVWWHLVLVFQALHRPPQQRLRALYSFIRSSPWDSRAGQAWKMIGDLYSEQSGDGMAAVKAYQQAELLGQQIPRLTAFSTGNWNAIPAFRNHPDYAFPVTVAVDLEVDPQTGAKPGERVFEIAAVRMKGRTILCEYSSFIRRPFRPKKMQTNEAIEQAPEPEQVAADLRMFIGEALVVGHNLRDFDTEHLSAMGVPIPNDRIVDTLTFARLLYPDSLRHNLALLYDHCIKPTEGTTEGEWHTALPDAHACGQLLYALGNELVQRGGMLLTGVRALVQPESAFDRAVLQPRKLPACPTLSWSLDPNPSAPHVLASKQGLTVSPNMQKALQGTRDVLVELHDPEGAYIKHLPPGRRLLVTVNNRTRLEHMLAAQQHNEVYVLPDPHTLLCPQRLRTLIERTADSEYRLLLFCLYQASHNHDASTLYPMRLPATDEPDLLGLQRDLLQACCSADIDHALSCEAAQAHLAAMKSRMLLLATHEALVHQIPLPNADLIIIDDAAELQMHLADYKAQRLSSDFLEALQLAPAEREALHLLKEQIAACVQAYAPQPRYHERISLHSVVRYLMQPCTPQNASVYDILQKSGNTGKRLAEKLKALCDVSSNGTHVLRRQTETSQEKHSSSMFLHAYWLDIWFSDKAGQTEIERWAICGISEDFGEVFLHTFWQPYKQHILCGTALTVSGGEATFLERCFHLPQGLPLLKDKRPETRVHIPSSERLSPAGFLCRIPWVKQIGMFLYALQAGAQQRSLVVTLHQKVVAEALAEAFSHMEPPLYRQVLTTYSDWTTTKIAERLTNPERSTLAVVAPRTRRTHLDVPVDVEITGQLQFLNQQDPLVAAHMRMFADLYPQEGPFITYLLPQALLELKTRLSSHANLHIILDSRLHTKVYRDETFQMLKAIAVVEDAPYEQENLREAYATKEQEAFLALLIQALEQRGFHTHENISDEELYLVLRRFWDAENFKTFPVDNTTTLEVTQKDIVRGVLNRKDQLLVAATGGGKSLCFQLPAILLADEIPPKVTLVFSPLISLMNDQVEALRQKGVFSAIMLNSSLSTVQRQEHLLGLKRGDYSIVYVAPEQIRASGLRKALEEREIGLIVIDEAHCLSQWGHDFRTDYFAVKDWIKRLCNGMKRQFPILALTATARMCYEDPQNEHSDRASTVDDIVDKLELNKSEKIMASPRRNELEFRVIKIEPTTPKSLKCTCGRSLELKGERVLCPNCSRVHRLTDTVVETAVEEAKLQQLVALLRDQSQLGLWHRWNRPLGKRQRGIVYCAYKKTTELVAEKLRESIPQLRVASYHAELVPEVKTEVLPRFRSDQEDGLDVVVATNAFGMGIDVRRLGFVIHFDIPGTPEAYYQEAGRAGRDSSFREGQERAACILLYHPVDLNKQRYLSRKNSISRYHVEDVYNVLCELRRDRGEQSKGETPEGETTQEVICVAQDIATRAAVSEEQIGMILYYLEYHTLFRGKPILERGETAHQVLQLKLEKGYKEQEKLLPENSPSRPLLKLFLHSDFFGLNEEILTTLSMRELAETLRWSISKLERELLNLVQRRIVTYECAGRINWTRDAAYARMVLTILKGNIRVLFNEIYKKEPGKFVNGETVFEDLTVLGAKLNLTAMPLTNFLHFLAALSHSNAGDLRLFKRFARSVRSSQPGRYEICLWIEEGKRLSERLEYIFSGLQSVLAFLEEQQVSNTEQEFDLLKLVSDYRRRQRLHRQLLLLHMLGVLKYMSDPSLRLALRVIFEPPYAPGDQLEIDLTSLRLKEIYEKNKLKLMERYATETQQDTRAETFSSYFYGKQSLLEHIDQAYRADLTPQQQTLLKFDGGLHLIEGPAGSGKTTVLIEYVKHLVYEKQVPIERIMITTHYNSATNRIAKELEVLQEGSNVALATTIHKFGEKIFRQYRLLLLRADRQPYFEKDPELRQENEDEVQKAELPIISEALRIIHGGTWQIGEPWPSALDLPKVPGTYQRNDELERQCWDAIKRLREHGIFPTIPSSKEDIAAALGKAKDEILSLRYAVYLVFLRLMSQENYYTFDDQILFALAILRNRPDIVREYQHFYEYILVDELQDFTPAQVELFLQLCRVQPNVLTFGDRDQEVRVKKTGAASVFEQLAQKESCGVGNSHHLSTNFRSTQHILDLVDHLRNYQVAYKRPRLLSAYGPDGEFPVMLRVRTYDDQRDDMSMSYEEGITAVPVELMMRAALEQMEQIPESERGSVALIAAKGNWSLLIERYLKSQKLHFSVLSNKSLYQLHHVDRFLVYLRLIADPRSDDDVGWLLRNSLVPYLESNQVKTLKAIAKGMNRSLFDLLGENKVLSRAHVTSEQQSALQKHLAVITQFRSISPVSEVEKALKTTENNPIAVIAEHEQKAEDIATVLKDLRYKTVNAALAEIKQHISFLGEEQKHKGLIATTVDHAKSEEFDTVFLIGADYIPQPAFPNIIASYKRRLYVSTSRVRQRLFLVVNGNGPIVNPILSSIPSHLYREVVWAPQRSENDVFA